MILPALEITLAYSAKSRDEPSATFADNIGADATVVFSGPVTLSSAGTLAFDSIINFTTDFAYNPADGSLLVQIVNTGGGSTTAFDYGPNAAFSRVFDFSSPGASGVVDIGDGLATEFLTATSVVPEPSTWAMMLLGFAGLGFVGHRRTRKAISTAA